MSVCQQRDISPLCPSLQFHWGPAWKSAALTQDTGSGGYADNMSGAVSTTGHGEAIMKVTLARHILFYMEQGNTHIHTNTVA
ncbi:hypothetical protein ILYODFUR_035646 [Ilyodon furcidens]|uniref:Uncharacterized protein n=1 Tax=Ilyodon furcidens TaxID=33524 RepID=A0ABV0T589_9TELE